MSPRTRSNKLAKAIKQRQVGVSARPPPLQDAVVSSTSTRKWNASGNPRGEKARREELSEVEIDTEGSEEGEEMVEVSALIDTQQEKEGKTSEHVEVETLGGNETTMGTVGEDEGLGTAQHINRLFINLQNSNVTRATPKSSSNQKQTTLKRGWHDPFAYISVNEASKLHLAKRLRQDSVVNAPERPTTATASIIYGPSLRELSPLNPEATLKNLMMDESSLQRPVDYGRKHKKAAQATDGVQNDESHPGESSGSIENTDFNEERTGYLSQIKNLEAKITKYDKALDQQVAKFNKCETELNDLKNQLKSRGTQFKWNKNPYQCSSDSASEGGLEEARKAVMEAQRLGKVNSENVKFRRRNKELKSELEGAQQGQREAERQLEVDREAKRNGDLLFEMLDNGYLLSVPQPCMSCEWKRAMEDYREKHKK